MATAEDTEIIELLQKGETRNHGFNLLMQKYQKRVYWNIRRMVLCHDDADDVTQSTFIKAWSNIENFNAQSSIFTWLFKISTNESLNYLAKQKRKSFFSLSSFEGTLLNKMQSDTYFDGDQIQVKLQEVLLKLPEKQRLVFNMKYFDEMKYEEIAEVLETSVGALKANYHHAVTKVEELIKKEFA